MRVGQYVPLFPRRMREARCFVYFSTFGSRLSSPLSLLTRCTLLTALSFYMTFLFEYPDSGEPDCSTKVSRNGLCVIFFSDTTKSLSSFENSLTEPTLDFSGFLRFLRSTRRPQGRQLSDGHTPVVSCTYICNKIAICLYTIL